VKENSAMDGRQEALQWLHQQLTWGRRLAELRRTHAFKSASMKDEAERAAA